MGRSGRLQRLVSFAFRPLSAALFVTVIFRSIFFSSSKKPINSHPHLSRSLVIASTTSSNLTWLSPALAKSHWTPQIYITDSPSASLTVPINKGNEAMVYLTYIIDNYDTLPDVVFFHHDHNQAWHQQFSSSYELANLNPSSVVKQGYINPRCLPGCENIIELSGDVVPLDDLKGAPRDVQISSVLHEFYHGDIPGKIAAPCCAQFAVSKEAIRKKGLIEWKAMRRWLLETKLDSMSSGRVLEYTWHLWFGMEPVFCPDEAQCLCDVYGVGNCS